MAENHVNMEEEEKRRRYLFLCDLGNDAFGRLKSDITYLKSRTMSFISVNLVILSIILALLSFLLQRGWQPSEVDSALLSLFVCFWLISLVINYSIYQPTHSGIMEFEIFKKKERLDKLLGMDEKTLYYEFLFRLQKAYEKNLNKYLKWMRHFIIAFYFFIFANISLIIFVIKNLINLV